MSESATVRLDDLSTAMARFEGLGRDLAAGYRALERRAERVERELELANAALEREVAELARVRGELEAVLAALPLGVALRDGTGRFTRANPEALRLAGHTGGDVNDPAVGAALDELCGREGVQQRRSADGSVSTLVTRHADVATPSGATGRVCLVDDQTELRRLAARVHTLDKMAALGTLSAGVAHEIRNPLSAVLGFASLLVKDLPAESRARRWAELIVQGASETDHIVSGLMTFASPGHVRIEEFDLAGLVDDVVESCVARLDRAERWRVTTDVPAVRVSADRVKLRQGLRNLVANAFDAQPRGGALDVSVRIDADGVHVAVADAGPGVADADRERVLDPFFTTRAAGTGLGLALTHTVARLHGGSLELAPGRSPLGGALFVLSLPPDCLCDASR